MGMPPGHDVTLGEVYRLVLRVDTRLDAITRDMVSRNEYEADQEAVDHRLSAVESKTSAEHAKLHSRIDALQTQEADVRKAQAQGRIGMWASIGAALVTTVGLVVVAIINRGGIL